MEFLNSTSTGATVGSWLYRVATAPEYESSVLQHIGPGDVTVLGLSGSGGGGGHRVRLCLDRTYNLANIPVPTDPSVTTMDTNPSHQPASSDSIMGSSAALSSTSPSSLVAGLTQMARGAAEHLVATVVTSPRSPTFASPFSATATAAATTSVSNVTPTSTLLTHRSAPVPVPPAPPSSSSRGRRHPRRTESWAILDADTADYISSYVTHGTPPGRATGTPPAARSQGSGISDSLANLALTESAIDDAALGGSWFHHSPGFGSHPSPPSGKPVLSGSPVFISNLTSPRSSRPPAPAVQPSPPARHLRHGSEGPVPSGIPMSTSVISMPDDSDHSDDDGFSDHTSDRSMSVITDMEGSLSSSGHKSHAGHPGDTVVLDVMGDSTFADPTVPPDGHVIPRHTKPMLTMEDECPTQGMGDSSADNPSSFTLVTTIPGTTPPPRPATAHTRRQFTMDLDEAILDTTGPPPAQPPRALSALVGAWHALPWFTYRTGLDHGTLRSDTGWGCMHRTVQMLVARAFLACVFSSSHGITSALFATRHRAYRAVMDMFADTREPAAGAFALPHICDVGARQFGVRPGAWFSPTVAAQVMHRLNDQRRVRDGLRASGELGTADDDAWLEVLATHPLGNAVDLVTHVAMDGVVTPEPVLAKAQLVGDAQNGKPLVGAEANGGRPESVAGGRWRPLLLMVPVRLGLDDIGQQYVPSLVDVFTWPQFVGCAGGRKDASLYFAGAWTRPPSTDTPDAGTRISSHLGPQTAPRAPPPGPALSRSTDNDRLLARTSLLFLDPHFPQPIPPPTTAVPNPSYHTSVIRALPMSRLDPCMLLGFLFRSCHDWDDFLDRANAWDAQAALFSVPDGWSALSRPSTADGLNGANRGNRNKEGGNNGDADDDGMMAYGLDSGLLDQAPRDPRAVTSKLRQPTPVQPPATCARAGLRLAAHHDVVPTSIPPAPLPVHKSRIPKPSVPLVPTCTVNLKRHGPVSLDMGASRAHKSSPGDELVGPYVHIPSRALPDQLEDVARAQHRDGYPLPLR